MRTVENANFAEQKNSDARTFGFGNFRAQIFEKRFNIVPPNIARNRSGKNQCQRFSVFAFHQNDNTKC